MSDRLCGYCRDSGHQVRKCPVYAEHRWIALSHTPKERKFLIDTLAKLGFGLGATFRLRDWYGSSEMTVTLVDHNWIKSMQFCSYKKVKYSKQVKITCKETFARIGENLLDPGHQYGSFSINGLVVQNGSIGEKHFTMRYASVLSAKNIPPDAILDGSGNNLAILSPSFTPYEYTVDDLVDRVYVHTRISDKKPESRWDDGVYERGILPA